jgi:hypothetical protein
MSHIVLLGDSIFDNKVYVGSGPDVVHQLREQLPHGLEGHAAGRSMATPRRACRATCIAAAGMRRISSSVPAGNDATDASWHSGAECGFRCRDDVPTGDVAAQFEASYRRMLDAC